MNFTHTLICWINNSKSDSKELAWNKNSFSTKQMGLKSELLVNSSSPMNWNFIYIYLISVTRRILKIWKSKLPMQRIIKFKLRKIMSKCWRLATKSKIQSLWQLRAIQLDVLRWFVNMSIMERIKKLWLCSLCIFLKCLLSNQEMINSDLLPLYKFQ